MIRIRHVAVVAVLALLAGCSSRPGAGEAAAAPPALDDLNELLHAAGQSGRTPSKLADLDRYKGKHSLAYEAVKSGDVVVLWGTAPKGEGQAGQGDVVIAYEKTVPTSGGYVLMAAGTVKKMTADEFASAPKGGKK
jgi:hypothetical protein